MKKWVFNPLKSKGWESWNVLKKYKLLNSDKGKLYVFSSLESKRIIKEYIKGKKTLKALINSKEIVY